MPLPVGPFAEAEGLGAVGLVGNDRLRSSSIEPLSQLGTVIGPIGKQLVGCLGASQQTSSGRTIVRLAAGQKDGKKTAFSICQCVDLRIAPAS
jgi:hypothetical protein